MRHQHRRPFIQLIARPKRDKRKERKIKLGTENRGIIASGSSLELIGPEGLGVPIKRDYWLHATKGYRSIRA